MASSPTPLPHLCIGWTTFETQSDASNCAKELLGKGLAFCVQVEGPVQSHYQWNGSTQSNKEFPVRIKHVDQNGPAIQQWLRDNHPYETPQWIAVKACDSLEEYFHWALQNSKTRSAETT